MASTTRLPASPLVNVPTTPGTRKPQDLSDKDRRQDVADQINPRPAGTTFRPSYSAATIEAGEAGLNGQSGRRQLATHETLSWRSSVEMIFAIGFDDAVVGLREISFQFFMQRGKCMIRHHRKHVMLDMIVHVPIR